MRTVTKTYGHERGYSCCFRQPRAKSHCRFLHGYALSFALTFACADDEVDENGWVIDFGGLKPVKAWLDENFDHKTILCGSDPAVSVLQLLNSDQFSYGPNYPTLSKLIDLIVLPGGVGCENFAEYVFETVDNMLKQEMLGETKAQLIKVEVREHGSNGASYEREFVPSIRKREQLTFRLDSTDIQKVMEHTVAQIREAVRDANSNRSRRRPG